MEIYLVGGAVRDALLGLPVQDRDWVVVGSTPAEMVALGFKPVGRDFPVFLHPVTHEEYALARTERKSAPGYRGFVVHSAPDVTLEQDLARRDVTINSIATYAQYSRLGDRNGIEHLQIQEPALTPPPVPPSTPLVDPFGGQADLRNKLLRHVTDAFCEDPVRILRVARFNARFPDFSVAPETMDLMRQMVRNGEADALVPERVWQELSKGLLAARPSKMMAVLAASGALGQVLPPLRAEADRAFDALDRAASAGASLPVRFTCLMSHFEADGAFLRRLPRPCADLAALWAREHSAIALTTSDTHEIVRLLQRCDAFRKPARFHELLACCALLQGVDTQKLTGALAAAVSVTSQAAEAAARQCSSAVVATALTGPQMAGAMHQARVRAVAGFLASNPGLT